MSGRQKQPKILQAVRGPIKDAKKRVKRLKILQAAAKIRPDRRSCVPVSDGEASSGRYIRS